MKSQHFSDFGYRLRDMTAAQNNKLRIFYINLHKKFCFSNPEKFRILTGCQFFLIIFPELLYLTVIQRNTLIFSYHTFRTFMNSVQDHCCFYFSGFFQYLINFSVHIFSCLN